MCEAGDSAESEQPQRLRKDFAVVSAEEDVEAGEDVDERLLVERHGLLIGLEGFDLLAVIFFGELLDEVDHAHIDVGRFDTGDVLLAGQEPFLGDGKVHCREY